MKKKKRKIIHIGGALLIAVIIGGCAGKVQKRSAEPTFYPTRVEYLLRMLPSPVKPMNVAIILEDMSGQYRRQENVASFSTAVSQAVTEMGIKAALKSPQWFTVLERKGINYLSMERKILKSANPNMTPPLKPADFIVLGGVSQFEHDIVTGGVGFRLLGIGASHRYGIDSVVVDLRVIDPVDGRVVQAVSCAKRIFSYEIRANVYKFIDEDSLLEGEVGGNDNEPAQLCVREALEKAMFMLCAEMGLTKTWPFKRFDQAVTHPVIIAYQLEKQRNYKLAMSENSYRTRKMVKKVAALEKESDGK